MWSSLDEVILDWISQVALVVRNLASNAGDIRNTGSVPRWGRSLGGGHGNPLLCSCLENPVDRGARWAPVHRIATSWTWLKWLSTHSYIGLGYNIIITGEKLDKDTKGRCYVKTETRIEVVATSQRVSGIVGNYQELGIVKKEILSEFSESAWPCQHLDRRFLAPRVVRQWISVLLSHPVCGNLLQKPQDTNRSSGQLIEKTKLSLLVTVERRTLLPCQSFSSFLDGGGEHCQDIYWHFWRWIFHWRDLIAGV